MQKVKSERLPILFHFNSILATARYKESKLQHLSQMRCKDVNSRNHTKAIGRWNVLFSSKLPVRMLQQIKSQNCKFWHLQDIKSQNCTFDTNVDCYSENTPLDDARDREWKIAHFRKIVGEMSLLAQKLNFGYWKG